MADPLSAARFLSALKAEGVRVVEVGDWRDHNRNHKGPWGPVHGVMIHHTVTKGSARTVDICRKGHSGLPGPLCHGVITKDGRVHLVGYGRANHAGMGDDDVLRAVIDEKPLPADNEANTDGNRHFYGFECENLGDGEDPWPAVQVEAMVRAAAAVLRAHDWNKGGEGAISVVAHAEWQPGKVDPRGPGYPGHAGIRSRVAERLKHPASWSPGSGTSDPGPNTETDMDLSADDARKFWNTDGAVPAARPPVANADYDDGNRSWTAGYALQTITESSRKTQKTLGAVAADVDKLTEAVANLTTLVTRLLAANTKD